MTKLSSSNIKNVFIFSQKKAFLVFWETKIPKKFLIFQEAELFYISGSLYFRKWNFIAQKYLTKFCYSLTKTPLGKSGCLSSLYYLPAAQGSRFLIHLSFPNTVSRDIFGTLPLTVQYSCDLRKAMPRHWSPSTCHSTFSREAKDFPRGGRYHKEVPLPTFCNMFNQ